MSRQFTPPGQTVTFSSLAAQAILEKTYDACESFHVSYRELRGRAGDDASSDTEQDVLRAMLVFACAGLDAALKQLVRDTLESVILRNPAAQSGFTEAVRRRLPDMERSRDLLATVLTAANPRQALLQGWIADLLADSLQSVAQISKLASAFGIRMADVADVAVLKDAFTIRNQIIHEMDIEVGANVEPLYHQPRRQRRQADMERHTAVILATGSAFLAKVDEKLT